MFVNNYDIINSMYNLRTLLENIIACFIRTRVNMDVEKYGGISPKPPTFPGHNFTCDFCFAKFFLNFKRIYSVLSVPYAFASTTMINDDI